MSRICFVKKFGKIHMEGEFINNDGTIIYRRTNNPVRIEECVEALCETITKMHVSKKDIFFVSNGFNVLIEDYPTVLKHNILSPILNHLPKNCLNVLEKNYKYKNLALNITALSLLGACVLSGSVINNDDAKLEKMVSIMSPSTYAISSIAEKSVINKQPIQNDVAQIITEEDSVSFEFDNFQSRLADVYGLPIYDDGYNLGSEINEIEVSNFLSSPRGYILIETAKAYGVDPYLLLAKAITESRLHHEETLPGGKLYNYAYGIMQIDNPADGKIIEAFNYNTNEITALELNKENVSDYEKNVQAGAMIMQMYLQKYNQNVFMAIQSYNYGDGMMSSILNAYAISTNKSVEDIINNPSDLGWIELVMDAHINPRNYISSWSGITYGDSNYLKKVLGHYAGAKTTNLDQNGNPCEIDIFNTLETINAKNHSR